MRSFSLLAFSGLSSVVIASPNYYQSVSSAQCTNPPTQSVTITETAPTVTITETATVGGSAGTQTTTAVGTSQTYHVDVGTFNGKLQFVPDEVNAEIGDVILYNFLAKSHSLTQSNFDTPCIYNGGFDIGLNQPNPNNITGLFEIPFEVKTTSPQWFYCKQPGPPNHCGQGMVFGLNPTGKMNQFIQNAIAQNGGQTNVSTITTATTASTFTTMVALSTTVSSTNGITTVTVGLDDGEVLRFDPPFIAKASAGDRIHFDFRAKNHTLTESTFDEPCTKLAGATIDTDFNNVNLDDIPDFHPFDITVASDSPRFFYCKQANGTPKGHCSRGMVFGLNIDGETFEQFQGIANATLPKA